MKPFNVLFVCVHNAGRSQMAEAFFNHLAAKRGIQARAVSAGTQLADHIHPEVETVMAEIGVSLEGHQPKLLNQALVDQADKVITMGCAVDADACPARWFVTEDWGLPDPKGRPIDDVRQVRDEIEQKVRDLIDANS